MRQHVTLCCAVQLLIIMLPWLRTSWKYQHIRPQCRGHSPAARDYKDRSHLNWVYQALLLLTWATIVSTIRSHTASRRCCFVASGAYAWQRWPLLKENALPGGSCDPNNCRCTAQSEVGVTNSLVLKCCLGVILLALLVAALLLAVLQVAALHSF